MSELSYAIPFEIFDALPQQCRFCPIARFTLAQMIDTGSNPEHVVADIQAHCSGWLGDELPVGGALGSEGDVLDLVELAIEDNCPYEIGKIIDVAVRKILA